VPDHLLHINEADTCLQWLVHIALKVVLLVRAKAVFLLQGGVELGGCLRANVEPAALRLVIRIKYLRGGPELLHRTNQGLLNVAIIDHIFIMICAPPSEEVDQTVAIESDRELLSEAQLELLDTQKAILVIVDVFDCAPHLGCLVRLLGHDRRQKVLIDLAQAL